MGSRKFARKGRESNVHDRKCTNIPRFMVHTRIREMHIVSLSFIFMYWHMQYIANSLHTHSNLDFYLISRAFTKKEMVLNFCPVKTMMEVPLSGEDSVARVFRGQATN